MNVLGLVFSLLLILSYGFYACWDKQLASARLRTTYLGHEKAHRKLINSYQSEIYQQFESKAKSRPPSQSAKKKSKHQPSEIVKKTGINPHCAKLNLWPLIQEGRENHPVLYELTEKLIRIFYTPLQNKKKRFESHFLDTFLSAAKIASEQEDSLALEKIDFKDEELQRIYYKMLKGTKRWDLNQQIGYPCILDYIKAEPTKDKICLFHANPDLLTVIFNSEIASQLYREIHKKKGPLLTKELIDRILSETRFINLSEDLFMLLELGNPDHKENKKPFVAEDEKSGVFLRTNMYLKG